MEKEFKTTDREEIEKILSKMKEKRKRKDPCIFRLGHPFNKCYQHRKKYIAMLVSQMGLS